MDFDAIEFQTDKLEGGIGGKKKKSNGEEEEEGGRVEGTEAEKAAVSAWRGTVER